MDNKGVRTAVTEEEEEKTPTHAHPHTAISPPSHFSPAPTHCMCVAEDDVAAGSRNFFREPDTARGCEANV